MKHNIRKKVNKESGILSDYMMFFPVVFIIVIMIVFCIVHNFTHEKAKKEVVVITDVYTEQQGHFLGSASIEYRTRVKFIESGFTRLHYKKLGEIGDTIYMYRNRSLQTLCGGE